MNYSTCSKPASLSQSFQVIVLTVGNSLKPQGSLGGCWCCLFSQSLRFLTSSSFSPFMSGNLLFWGFINLFWMLWVSKFFLRGCRRIAVICLLSHSRKDGVTDGHSGWWSTILVMYILVLQCRLGSLGSLRETSVCQFKL